MRVLFNPFKKIKTARVIKEAAMKKLLVKSVFEATQEEPIKEIIGDYFRAKPIILNVNLYKGAVARLLKLATPSVTTVKKDGSVESFDLLLHKSYFNPKMIKAIFAQGIGDIAVKGQDIYNVSAIKRKVAAYIGKLFTP